VADATSDRDGQERNAGALARITLRSTYFFINAIKKVYEKRMLLKQHVFLTCQGTHINLIYGLYKISYKPIYKKFMSF
jgi:hypothetical protein